MLTVTRPERRRDVRQVMHFHRRAQLFGHVHRAVDVQARKQHGEFLAAVAGGEIELGLHACCKKSAQRSQAAISRHMTVVVVERLEMIGIDHQQGERLLARHGMQPFRTRAAGRTRAGSQGPTDRPWSASSLR